jgi:hypothetical protein
LQKELNKLLDKEDLKWRQRAKANWLKMGDRNTKFFYANANQRRKSNQILTIKDEMGAIWESPADIRGALINYFYALCTAGNIGDMV